MYKQIGYKVPISKAFKPLFEYPNLSKKYGGSYDKMKIGI